MPPVRITKNWPTARTAMMEAAAMTFSALRNGQEVGRDVVADHDDRDEHQDEIALRQQPSDQPALRTFGRECVSRAPARLSVASGVCICRAA